MGHSGGDFGARYVVRGGWGTTAGQVFVPHGFTLSIRQFTVPYLVNPRRTVRFSRSQAICRDFCRTEMKLVQNRINRTSSN